MTLGDSIEELYVILYHDIIKLYSMILRMDQVDLFLEREELESQL